MARKMKLDQAVEIVRSCTMEADGTIVIVCIETPYRFTTSTELKTALNGAAMREALLGKVFRFNGIAQTFGRIPGSREWSLAQVDVAEYFKATASVGDGNDGNGAIGS